MPVERIDAQIQSLISGANFEAQKKVDKEDDADVARKAAEKKIVEKKETLKSSTVQRETFQRQNDLQNKMRQVLGGAQGAEAAQALGAWQNNPGLQAKLTDAQKNLFMEAMAKNPKQASDAGNAMNRLSGQAGFERAITSSQQMATLQAGLLENPKAERPVSEMLQNRFMQSAKADPNTKNQFLRFGLQQAAKGNMDAMKRAGDMLGLMTKSNLSRTTQQAGMQMVQRHPGDAKATANVDAFMQHPEVGRMPSFARSKATELLAKASGTGDVKEGFESLASHPKFKAQTAANKGRFFATIGTGRPSEYRAITDKSLAALQSANFPNRSGQVGRFLGKLAGHVQKGNVEGASPEDLIKSAKTSELPKAPVMLAAENLSPEDAQKVRAQNRAKVIQYYNQLSRIYEQGEKKLNAAKYLEDVNALQNLREAEAVDVSALSPEDQAFARTRQQGVKQKLDQVRGLQRQRSRELRTKRMPPAKRRARVEARRLQGTQPKYFNPNTARVSGKELFAQPSVVGARPQGLQQTPARAQLAQHQGRMAAGGGIEQQVAQVVSQLGQGPMTPQRAGQVAQAIAAQVTQQVVAQVTAQLLNQPAVGIANPHIADIPEDEKEYMKRVERNKTQRLDQWGVPRAQDRDLGGNRLAAVKPPPVETSMVPTPGPSDDGDEQYTGRMMVKDPSSIRSPTTLFATSWKGLNKAEKALLKNLGWAQQAWDTKETPAAKWPMSMATPFASLTVTQREAVRKLGYTAHDWDQKIQAFTMGKNA